MTDGLDIEEIRLSSLENSFTLGAEYYGKIYIDSANTVKSLRHKTLCDISKRITDGDHGSPDYQASGILYLLSESVQAGYIDTSKCRFITPEKNRELKRSELHPGDVVVTKTGVYYGKSAVVPNSVKKANMIAHVGKIELYDEYNPYYVSTFLNSKFGYYQLRRRGIKATRPEIKLVEFAEIMIPIFSDTFNKMIESIIISANEKLDSASAIMAHCEDLLIKSLGFEAKKIASSNCSIRLISNSYYIHDRLDAEYYQQKYDQYLEQLHRFETTTISVEFDVFRNSGTNYADGISDVGVIKTKQLSNGEIDFDGVESYFDNRTCANNKSVFLKENDVVFASMGVGSLGKVSIFSSDGARRYVTDSTLRIYRAKPTCRIKPEALCVFLRSKIGQELIYRYVVGSTGIINIYDDDMSKIPIPILADSVQANISAQVQESFALRKQSKRMLEYAKQAVEMAIEQGEDEALKWLEVIRFKGV